MTKYTLLFLIVVGTYGCGNTTQTVQNTPPPVQETPLLEVKENGNIKLYEQFSTDIQGAVISPIKSFSTDSSISYDFSIYGFQLGSQTTDAATRKCANSSQGQHIHNIINNMPYTAEYKSTYEKKLAPGNYVSLSFLSRSYHESVKSTGAYYMTEFSVGNVPSRSDGFDLRGANLFYSRPKGVYVGELETGMVLLDFFITGCELSENGYFVIATINGKSFKLTRWRAFWIEGLPMGESTVQLSLHNADGSLVKSPYNPVTRTITLKDK
jgi:hypothetical protein